VTHCAKHLLRIGSVPLGTLKGWRLAPLTDLRPDGEALGKQAWDVGRTIGYRHAGRLKRGDLALRGPEVSGDNRAGVAEGLAGRGIPAADERDDRHLGQVLGDERSGIFFVRAADFAAKNQRAGLRIVLELPQALDKRRSDNRVAADADAGRLAEALARKQVDDLVGQGSRTRHDAHAALFKDVARHDADERLSRRDETGTVRADDAHPGRRTDHFERIVHRHAFGDANRKRDSRFVRLVERVGGKGRRNEDASMGRAGRFNGLFDGVEDGEPAGSRLPPLAGRDPAHQIRSIFHHAVGVIRTLRPGDALYDYPAVLV